MDIIPKAEKKPDPKAAALPFYKRFTYPFTRKQVGNMLIMSLLVMMPALVVMLIMPWRGSVLELCQETKIFSDPSWSPHLFTDLVSFGSRHLVIFMFVLTKIIIFSLIPAISSPSSSSS